MKVFQEQYRLYINGNNYRTIINDVRVHNSATHGEHKTFYDTRQNYRSYYNIINYKKHLLSNTLDLKYTYNLNTRVNVRIIYACLNTRVYINFKNACN